MCLEYRGQEGMYGVKRAFCMAEIEGVCVIKWENNVIKNTNDEVAERIDQKYITFCYSSNKIKYCRGMKLLGWQYIFQENQKRK